MNMGIQGVAYATVIAQIFSAVGIVIYSVAKLPQVRINKKHMIFKKQMFSRIASFSLLASVQQSIMNFGILMIQGLVNSFGVNVMAAFAAGVKIESFAYMPMQDFGNAFSTFIAQNKGARNQERIKVGIISTIKVIAIYSLIISALVMVFAGPLLKIFIDATEVQILDIGMGYVYVVAPFYILIGYLFMFYGLYRGLGKSGISIILTIASLGTRVILAYSLSAIASIGLVGIWWSIPIGWVLADLLGLILLLKHYKRETK